MTTKTQLTLIGLFENKVDSCRLPYQLAIDIRTAIRRARVAAGAAPDHSALLALREVRAEITRLNSAPGETVFNPVVLALVDEAIATGTR